MSEEESWDGLQWAGKDLTCQAWSVQNPMCNAALHMRLGLQHLQWLIEAPKCYKTRMHLCAPPVFVSQLVPLFELGRRGATAYTQSWIGLLFVYS